MDNGSCDVHGALSNRYLFDAGDSCAKMLALCVQGYIRTESALQSHTPTAQRRDDTHQNTRIVIERIDTAKEMSRILFSVCFVAVLLTVGSTGSLIFKRSISIAALY